MKTLPGSLPRLQGWGQERLMPVVAGDAHGPTAATPPRARLGVNNNTAS